MIWENFWVGDYINHESGELECGAEPDLSLDEQIVRDILFWARNKGVGKLGFKKLRELNSTKYALTY